MDSPYDIIRDSEMEILQLNATRFKEFLIEEKYVTNVELEINPAIVCELMGRDGIWEAFRETMRNAYQCQRQDEEKRWGGGQWM